MHPFLITSCASDTYKTGNNDYPWHNCLVYEQGDIVNNILCRATCFKNRNVKKKKSQVNKEQNYPSY